MNYQESKNATLPDLARIVLDAAADIPARIAAFDVLKSRWMEIPDSWSGFDDSERAALRAAFAIDAETMAACGFIPEGV